LFVHLYLLSIQTVIRTLVIKLYNDNKKEIKMLNYNTNADEVKMLFLYHTNNALSF